MRAILSIALLSAAAAITMPARAHNVWCHGTCGNPKSTVEFYQRAGDVYLALSKLKLAWQEANSHLEHGVIAEFESKLDATKPPRPHEFRYALQGYMHMRVVLNEFDDAVGRLQGADAKCDKVAKYEAALARVLADGRSIPRLSQAGVRYADAAGLPKESISKIDGTTAILTAWRADTKILMTTLDAVIGGLRDAIPLAEKGEFATVMLSGRNAFGDKMPQFTDMFSAFDRLYVMTVMATIQTTMEVYPTGYEWLAKKP